MAYLEIPVRTDIPNYEFQITLDGELFILEFKWNERGQFWSMDIFNIDREAILTGIQIVADYPLLVQYVIDALPQGEFYCYDTSGKGIDPGVGDFGVRAVLLYREITTPAEL